jgi:hypothetical protein
MSGERAKYKLNSKQLRLLGLLYKFRFVTVPLLTEYLELKSNSVSRNLKVLLEQEYIGWKYEASWKIDRKPAVYYLDKKAIGLLKEDRECDPGILHAYYKNKVLSDETRKHYLDTMAAYIALLPAYDDSYFIFTKNEIASDEEFPKNKPDLYLKNPSTDDEYFITLAHDVQPFLTRKRLAEYVEHSEEEGWPFGDYPALLFVLKNASHEKQFLDHAEKVLENTGISNEELPIGATTIKALTQKPYTAAIWTFLGDDMPSMLSD